MKKFFVKMFAMAMVFSMAACGKTADNETISNDDAQKHKTVTIQALNANQEKTDIEVPYNPQRIAILDMPALDIIDALGLGERVVGSAKVTIEYLTDYNPEDSDGAIMNLGTIKTADLEKVAASEPDIIFIGGRLASIYAELETIAPVVYLTVD